MAEEIGLRSNQTFLDVSLPGFVIPDTSFGLFMRQVHFLGHVINARRAIVLGITIARSGLVQYLGVGPLLFDLIRSLDTTKFRHFRLSPRIILPSQNFRIADGSLSSQQY
jgi:hypothetical protein